MSKKEDNSEQQDLEVQQNEGIEDLYLSSVFDNDKYQNLKYITESKMESPLLISLWLKVLFIISYIYSFLTFIIFLMIFMPLLGALAVVSQMFTSFTQVLVGFWAIISGSSAAYCFVVYFFFNIQNDSIRFLFQDGIFFAFSSFLVISYLRVTVDQFTKFNDIIFSIQIKYHEILTTVFQTHLGDYDACAYFLDYNDSCEEKIQYQNKIDHPVISNRFSYFSLKEKQSLLNNSVNIFIQDFTKYIEPNFKHYLILVGIVLLKLSFVFLFIHIHSIELLQRDIIDLTFITFVYLYIAWNLNRLLGNNDLIRKRIFLQQLNEYIKFSDVNKQNYEKKLDVICPISLEAWDNIRKFILEYKQELLGDLELSYFCLIFYYLFVILVSFSSYFELYWIFSKDSFFLNPIIVIMSTFNFVFLSVFLLFRFKEGSTFSQSFQELEQSVTLLQDQFEDMDTMYNKFFIEKLENEYQEQRLSPYGLMIKRIKLLSRQYINQKIMYQDRLFTMEEKQILRRKIIKNTIKSLQKIKASIQSDSNQYKYKFMNIIELNTNDFLFTLAFGLITTLPTIVPKFISFYDKQ